MVDHATLRAATSAARSQLFTYILPHYIRGQVRLRFMLHAPAGSWHVPATMTGCTLFVFYPEG
jgi:hypothetical protein